DRAVVQDMRAKIFASQERYMDAVAPWEEALRLNEKYSYFEPKWALDTMELVAKLNYTVGTDSKTPAAQQGQYIDRAIGYLSRIMKDPKKLTPENSMLYSSILYNK